MAAAATGNKSWSKLDVDLYKRFFTGRAKVLQCCAICDGSQHSAASCPLPAAGRKEGYSFSCNSLEEASVLGSQRLSTIQLVVVPVWPKVQIQALLWGVAAGPTRPRCARSPQRKQGGSDCGSRPPAAVARRPDLLDGSMYTPKKLMVPFSAWI